MSLSHGGHLVARVLGHNGVRCVFTHGGQPVAPIVEGCAAAGIDVVETRHARDAAHAADAWARLTRRPGVALVSTGPGVADTLAALANAAPVRSPLLVLAAGTHPELDPVPLLRPLTRWSASAGPAERLPELLQAALRHAWSGLNGPAFLQLPGDVLAAPADATPLPAVEPPPAVLADPERVKAAGKLVAQAERPLLFVGSPIWWDDAAELLREMVNRVGLPTIMTGMARGALPSSNPHALNLARDKAFAETDCLITVGPPIDPRTGAARVIQIDRDPTELGRHRPVDVGLVGDARSVLAQLETAAVALGARPERFEPWCESLLVAEEKARAAQQPLERSDARPIHPHRLARAVADAVHPDVIVIHDGGEAASLATRVVPSERPGHWLQPGPLGATGLGAAFALAARKLHPDKPVLVLAGDGFDPSALATCARLDLPVTVLVAGQPASPATTSWWRRSAVAASPSTIRPN